MTAMDLEAIESSMIDFNKMAQPVIHDLIARIRHMEATPAPKEEVQP